MSGPGVTPGLSRPNLEIFWVAPHKQPQAVLRLRMPLSGLATARPALSRGREQRDKCDEPAGPVSRLRCDVVSWCEL